MKKTGTIILTLALAGTLATGAAAQGPELAAVPDPVSYESALFVNGKELDVSGLPAAQGIPARLLAEADYGFADWYPEDDQAMFALEGYGIYVTCSTGAVEINGTALEGATAEIKDGVTFLPVSVIEGLEGYQVDLHSEMDVSRIDITTPNGTPMAQLAYQVREASEAAANNKLSAEELAFYGFAAEDFIEVSGLFPMNISPDTVLVGKVAEGRLDSVKEALERYRQTQEDTFSWYLPQNLPKVQDARLETEGAYVLFLIAENADAGAALFHEAVQAMAQE